MVTASDVAFHPIATVFPAMSELEFEQLKSDIVEQGQLQPIALWRGLVIDGRHRLRACIELEVEPDFYDLADDADPVAYAISCNLHRRQLTTSQRSMVAARLATMKVGDNQHKKEGGPNGLPSEQAAELLGVAERSVKRAKQVIENGSKDLVEAVETGCIPVSLAAKFVTEQPDKREQSAIVKHGAPAVRDYLKDEPSPVPTRSEEESTNNLAEFKKLWKRCSQAGKVAIRIWMDENYLETSAAS